VLGFIVDYRIFTMPISVPQKIMETKNQNFLTVLSKIVVTFWNVECQLV